MAATAQNHVVDTFTRSLDRLSVEWTRVPAAGFEAALSAVLLEPAIGAELPLKGVSLEGLPVELHPTPAQLTAARTGITAALFGVADYGCLALEQGLDMAEPASLFPALHVAIVRASDLVPGMTAAFQRLGASFRQGKMSVVLATGPSATADMGALVRGAHGPKDVHVIILEDR